MPPKKRSNNSNSNKNNKKPNNEENPRQLDPVFGQIRALPIPLEILNSVTPSTIPSDPETYLAMVRKQAESGSSIMFIQKEIDYDENVITSKHIVKIAEPESNTDEESESDEVYLQYLNTIFEGYRKEKENLPEVGELPIPSSFIFPNNFTEWRKFCMTNKPDIALISNFDHPLTMKLIIYCTKWLNNSVPKQISEWIYALLIKVPNVLEATDVSILRDLAVKAKKINEKFVQEAPHTTKFTTEFIQVIVARDYGQKDLDIK